MEAPGSPPATQPRRRGRPPKNIDDEQESIKHRREQVRRAQHAFRIRREAAQKAQEERIKSLESVVEKMSTSFLDFTDSVIHAGAVRQDAGLMQKLLTTVREAVDLSQSASTSEAESDSLPRTGRDAMAALNHALHATVSDSMAASPDSMLSDMFAQQQQLQAFHYQTTPPSANQIPSLMPDEATAQGPPFIDSEWPESVTQSLQQHMTKRQSSFEYDSMERYSLGLKLIQKALETGHRALLLDECNPCNTNNMAVRIFKYAFMFRSKQEIQYAVEWFLGPGFKELGRLGSMPCGKYPFELAASRDMLDQSLPSNGHPFVDEKSWIAAKELHDRAFDGASPFVNAFQMAEYLQAKNIRHIDHERMEIPATSLRSHLHRPSQQHPTHKQTYLASKSAELAYEWDFSTLSVDGNTNGQPSADMDAFLSVTAPPSTYTIRLKTLLENLTLVGICLSQGPCWYKPFLDDAIEASIINPEPMPWIC